MDRIESRNEGEELRIYLRNFKAYERCPNEPLNEQDRIASMNYSSPGKSNYWIPLKNLERKIKVTSNPKLPREFN